MKTIFAVVCVCITVTITAQAQMNSSFSLFLQNIFLADQSQRSALVDSFMTAQGAKGFPVLEDSAAHFLYRGAVASKIVLTGDHTRWSTSGESLTNIAGTDLFYISKQFEPDARIDYKFSRDGVWILDPLDPDYVSGGFGPNSELAMPSYVQPVEIQYQPSIPHGTFDSFSFFSSAMNNTRTVQVYRPPGYPQGDKRYPTLYVHDGPDYITLGFMANVLDGLIAAGKIEPVLCVFVPPTDRANEYRMSKLSAFTQLMTSELVPRIDSVYQTDARASRRGVLGSSDGGHVSLYLAVTFSGIFGLCAGQSSTITDQFKLPVQNGPFLPVKFYLDCGTYDIAGFIEANRAFKELLSAKGYTVSWAEYHEGHSWGNWRAHLDDVLLDFFPGGTSSAAKIPSYNVPDECTLFSPFPNPFNPVTEISYRISRPASVSIRIINALGELEEHIFDGVQDAGIHAVRWDASDKPSGVYFCSVTANGVTHTQKLILVK